MREVLELLTGMVHDQFEQTSSNKRKAPRDRLPAKILHPKRLITANANSPSVQVSFCLHKSCCGCNATLCMFIIFIGTNRLR